MILNGLGFDKYKTSLLNIPFGFVQWLIILLASWFVQRFRIKSAVVVAFVLPVIAGLAVLYTVPRTPGHSAPLLVGYYLLAFLFGTIPVEVAWVVANTAGTTKKSTIMCKFNRIATFTFSCQSLFLAVYNAASSTGNIIGPIVFNSKDAPDYLPGLRVVLGFFVATAACAILQAVNLTFLNKLQERRRVANGKPAKIKDTSMSSKYQDIDGDEASDSVLVEQGAAAHSRIGQNAFADMTDRENDEFVYVL